MDMTGPMTPEHWHRIEQLFEEARHLPRAERDAWLMGACGDDAALLAEVRALLEQDDQMHAGFLEPATRPVISEPDPEADSLLGERFGVFEVVRLIGRGGMGAVYEARQDHPRRTVALKVLSRQVLSRDVLARFRSEAEILARLRHPAIAEVYQAGMHTVRGLRLPYFAMELIPEPRPITRYADERGLTIRERLELFATVCDAVHYGHQKGIIHRDLKPANILVGSDGRPKVIDFGVARVTDKELSVVTGHTQAGQIIGTPQYMCPEQCRGELDAVDTRSDVYSLGVVLYELLAGELPYEMTGSTLVAVSRVICEQTPRRLSHADARLRGDLETIVHKTLEKEPERRYASVQALVDDIRRHLRSEPIAARPPSAVYVLSRYVRRHRAASAAMAATLVILVAALAAISSFAIRTSTARDMAERARDKAILREYDARIAAAEAAVLGFNPQQAVALLEDTKAIPKRLRGWEWYHLRSRVDQSVSVGNLDGEGVALAIAREQNLVLAVLQSKGVRLLRLSASDEPLPDIEQVSCWPPRGSGVDTRVFSAAFSGDGRFLVTCEEMRESEASAASRSAPSTYIDVWEYIADGVVPGSPDVQRLGPWVRRVHRRMFSERSVQFYMAIHPRLPVFALASTARGVELWEMPDPSGPVAKSTTPRPSIRLIAHLGRHERTCEWLRFSPNGALLATGGTDHTTCIWDVEAALDDARARSDDPPADLLDEGQPYRLCVLVGQPDHIRSGDFSPDGKRLATASVDGTIWLWRVPTLDELRAGSEPQPIGRLAGHRGPVKAVAFDSSGNWLFSGGADRTVRVWYVREQSRVSDTQRTKFVQRPACRLVNTLHGHANAVFDVRAIGDGRVVSISHDKTVRVWYPFVDDVPQMREHFSSVTGVAFSPDDRHLLSVGGDGALMIWDPNTTLPVAREHLRRRELTNQVVTWRAGDHDWAATTSGHWKSRAIMDSGEVIIWDIDTPPRVGNVWHYPKLPEKPTGFLGVAISADGRRLAAGDKMGRVFVWDVSSLPDAGRIDMLGTRVIAANTRVRSLAWLDAAGRWLVCGLVRQHLGGAFDDVPGGSLRVWCVGTDRVEVLRASSDSDKAIRSIALAPGGDVLAVLYESGAVWLYPVAWSDGQPRIGQPRKLVQTEGFLRALAFYPDRDQHRLAVGAVDGSIRIWDYRECVELATLRGQLGVVNSLAFDRKGHRLASASAGQEGADNVVYLWERPDSQERRKLARTRSIARQAQYVVWRLAHEVAEPGDVRKWIENKRIALPESVRRFALEHFPELECDVNWYRLAGVPGAIETNMPHARREQRLKWLQAAHERAPEHRLIWVLIAATYYQLGREEHDPDAARRDYEKALAALRIDGKQPDCFIDQLVGAHATAALLYQALGKTERARQHLRKMESLLEAGESWPDEYAELLFLARQIVGGADTPDSQPAGEQHAHAGDSTGAGTEGDARRCRNGR